MRRLFYLTAVLLSLASCQTKKDPEPAPEPEPPVETFFAKGADIGWVTEMESRGYKFYSPLGDEMECTALLRRIGFNAVRHRVWVNPADGWCNKEDVLVKCKRAQALGMKIMIDFHYGDSWCDPGKQPVPAAWKGHNADQLADDVAGHTEEVLSLLKSNGIDVTWVQVGNEVTNGMLWETCRVKGSEAGNFIKVFNAGAAAARKVYPETTIILHIDNGWNRETAQWFFDLTDGKADYDMMGFSLYPAYWDDSLGGYPDWKPKTQLFVDNLGAYYTKYKKPIMLCEFGMPARQPEQSKAALQFLLDNTKDKEYFMGIFLWEPESEPSRNGYDQGAFSNGTPTLALSPFNDSIASNE